MTLSITELLLRHSNSFHPVVKWAPEETSLVQFDFTANNKDLEVVDLTNINLFCDYINEHLKKAEATFGIGGYNENRILYKRSTLFDGTTTPRTIHLGIDIWGNEGTAVFAPLDATIHSFAFNNHYGDYGATIILQHQLEGILFHTLYGHVSLRDIEHLQEGALIQKGQLIAHFGQPEENGYWPPHLHFQIIQNMENKKGDYPGVCTIAEREAYLTNCPDADLILGIMRD
jgi:peptidoglycan LD-endopeptidase LytH